MISLLGPCLETLLTSFGLMGKQQLFSDHVAICFLWLILLMFIRANWYFEVTKVIDQEIPNYVYINACLKNAKDMRERGRQTLAQFDSNASARTPWRRVGARIENLVELGKLGKIDKKVRRSFAFGSNGKRRRFLNNSSKVEK